MQLEEKQITLLQHLEGGSARPPEVDLG